MVAVEQAEARTKCKKAVMSVCSSLFRKAEVSVWAGNERESTGAACSFPVLGAWSQQEEFYMPASSLRQASRVHARNSIHLHRNLLPTVWSLAQRPGVNARASADGEVHRIARRSLLDLAQE
ncbi:hypothetical protein KRP22_008541 [Phytophthora ramorum]|nr:hypothetical protein KRP22_7374 [Phytophthora ramorum]